MDQNKVLEELSALPPAAQQQVIDFIAFLQTRYSKTTSKRKRSPRLSDEPFVGIWRNRKDMADSNMWVRKARADEWK
jgi:hypothetical protein